MPETSDMTLRDLLADPPLLHGPAGGEAVITHGLLPVVLEHIDATVRPGSRTLETGCGLSTILFAMRGAEHTCITPAQDEIDRVLAYCAEHGIDTSKLTFHAKTSERVLPMLDLGELDLVLIDGSHSFPQAFLDWFYVQEALKIGATLIVDDVHLWTGRVLQGFLEAEPEWKFDRMLGGRTVAFEKLAHADPNKVWYDQPFVARKTNAKVLGRARIAIGLLREGDLKTLPQRVRSFRAGT